MALTLDQFDVMEHLWETLEKTPDGKHIRYTGPEVEQLWWMGFVDTANVRMEDWKRVFEPLRQADGSYLLARDDFLALDRYRFKGEIRIPFDPLQINEGKYTNDGLDDLIESSIAPSCSLPHEKVREFFDTLKRDFRQPDGLILIKRPAKERIKTLLDANPSPLRNLELLLDQMIAQRGDDLEKQIDAAELDGAAMKAAAEASSFSATPTTRVEEKAQRLRALEKARKEAAGEVEGVAKTELRKIRRSRKGMRG